MRRKIQNCAMIVGLIAAVPFMTSCMSSCTNACLARQRYIVSNDFAAPYLQRIDRVSADAGDAKRINAAIHVIDPWPRYAGYRRIPANGERMAGAVERYRDVSKLPSAPRPITQQATGGISLQ